MIPDGDLLREGGDVCLRLLSRMDQMTWDRIGEESVENAQRNRAVLDKGRSIAALRGQQLGNDDSATVIAAGPSVKRQDPLSAIKQAKYDGAIVATDSAIYYCLRNGVVPDLVVTLDPHPTRIVRWFGDTSLGRDSLDGDDYFRRQDMDEAFSNELKVNEEILRLLDRYGKQMKIALSTSASEAVVTRAIETGMDIYWWNPMLDDPDDEDSITRELQALNGLPCINGGGNVGAACWMISDVVLEKKRVALTGIDFSYYDGTPYENTQYYYECVNLVGEENLKDIFIRIHNPHLDAWFYTDPAYMWYREIFLEMAASASCKTYNCTEGGILFGNSVDFIPLAEFLGK